MVEIYEMCTYKCTRYRCCYHSPLQKRNTKQLSCLCLAYRRAILLIHFVHSFVVSFNCGLLIQFHSFISLCRCCSLTSVLCISISCYVCSWTLLGETIFAISTFSCIQQSLVGSRAVVLFCGFGKVFFNLLCPCFFAVLFLLCQQRGGVKKFVYTGYSWLVLWSFVFQNKLHLSRHTKENH